ncbi:MAG TPA: hypothetical protein VEH84_09445 [Alphaproteobacteria bacterium]|nr:hypothetical protein [Alphaproteobacteria bacterium]
MSVSWSQTVSHAVTRELRARRRGAVLAVRRMQGWLEGRGIKARVLGDLARGTFGLQSPLEMLVVLDPGPQRDEAVAALEAMAEGMPLVLTYFGDLETAARKRALAEMKDAMALPVQ